jgi:hypothetical protein
MEDNLRLRRWRATWISFVYVMVVSLLQGRGFDLLAVLFFITLVGIIQYEISRSRSFHMESEVYVLDSEYEVD